MARQVLFFRVAVLALLTAVFGTGLAFLVLRAGEGAGTIEILLPRDSPAREAVVYVSGAVAREGVYTLREGDRVADAVEAAGGFAPDADRDNLNLAARLSDEQHVRVPRLGESIAGAAPATASASPPGLVNINTASQAQLEGLPGIGPRLAQAIIEYRRASGGFSRVEDLLKVPRIGEETLARLRPYISVR